MAEQWYPGAQRNPGANAGFKRGRVRKECVKIHYTVGRNSTGIGLQGYFQWLISRNGYEQQFAEADAICWDSGEWNDAGPGIEFEYYEPTDGPHPENILTPQQIEAGGKLIRWLHTEHGYPLDYYDTGGDNSKRLAESSGFRGFISHRSLIQSERHYDYISREQWAAMVGPSAPTPEPRKIRRSKHMIFAIINGEKGEAYQHVGGPTTDKTSYVRLYGNEALVNHDHGSPLVRMTRAEFQAYISGHPLDDLGARGWTF